MPMPSWDFYLHVDIEPLHMLLLVQKWLIVSALVCWIFKMSAGSLSFRILLQGFVTVSLAGQSFNTTSGSEILLSAAPLTYRKQTACIPVVTTASEYT